MRYGWVVLLFVGVAICLSGCGSNATEPAIDQVLEPRIAEYVGDGGGSLKPWPNLLALTAFDSPSVTGSKLKVVDQPKTGKVPRKQVSWYRAQAIKEPSGSMHVVVTLQPTVGNEDSDLFVLEGKAKNFNDGADTLKYSRRAPTEPDTIIGGGAPDWVQIDLTNTAGWPGAHVAVLGANNVPAVKHFRIEIDEIFVVTANGSGINGGTGQHDSLWYALQATAGTNYTVSMQDTGAGDPDCFVYGDAATKFIGKDTSAGHASIPFTASETGMHFIRIYGYGSGTSDYRLQVSSP